MLRLRFLDEARDEARRAIEHYLREADDVTVALRFEAALQRAVQSVLEAPERWPVIDKSIGARWYLLDRPFDEWLIVYRLEEDEVRVLAVSHGRREPAYWRGRR